MTPKDRLDIRIDAPGWAASFDDIEALCRRAVDAALAVAPAAGRDRPISLLLTSDATMRRLNASYRGQDKATNVLSFAADADDGGGKFKAASRVFSATSPSALKRSCGKPKMRGSRPPITFAT